MKTKLLSVLLLTLCAIARAQIPVTTNTAAPALGADDVYYLPGPVDEATGALSNGGDNVASSDNDALTYIASGRTSKGQSFTTGSNPDGYIIRSVTVRRVRWSSYLDNGTYLSLVNGSSYPFRFGSISGSSLTPTVTTNAVYSGSAISGFTSGDLDLYLTFDVSKLGIGNLAANSTYFFEIATPTSGFFELHNTRTGSLYAGGDAFHGDNNNVLDTDDTVTMVDGDFAFHVKLLPGGGPTVTAVAVPSSALSGQSFTVTATATPGSGGAVTSVTIDLSSIGGSAAAVLVAAGGNTYTNTFTVSGGAPVGATSLEVTATDASALLGFYNLAFTVLPADMVWDGGSGVDDKWSSGANWVGDAAPALSGSAVTFAGTTRLTPDMDGNYSLTGLVFSNTAGNFIISSSTAGKLTNGSGGVINNSTSAQTLNVPVVLNVAQAFDAAAGDIVLSNSLTANAAFGKAGAGALVFAGAVTNSLGNTMVTNGLVRVANGVVNIVETSGALTKIDKGAGVEVSGGTLNISGAGGWFPVGDTVDTTNTLTVSGGAVNVLNQYGIQVPRIGNGVLTLTAGNMTVNDTGGLGLTIGDNGAAQTGVVNLDGGKLTVNRIRAFNGVNNFYFNGGTLSPIASRTDFMSESASLSVQVRDGGGTIDTAGIDITIAEHLLHSTVGGDAVTDGGLTKVGNGVLTMESDGSGYNGPTKVLGGTLNVSVSYLGVPGSMGDLLVSNATFNFSDTFGVAWPANNVTLTNGATLNLTNTPSVAGISAAGNLKLAGSTVSVYLQSTPSVAPVSVAGSLSVSGANTIRLSGLGVTAGSTFPVIDYTGTPVPTNGFVLVLPPGSNGYLSNNVANTSLDVVITASGQNLSWHGTFDTSVLLPNWNINASENWYDSMMNPAKYLQYSGNSYGDNVTFGDLGYNLTGTNEVNLPVRVVPAAVAINNTAPNPYTLTGPGGIDGATSLVKNNTGYALLATSNNFTGGTTLNAGTLAITNDSALGTNSGSLTIAGGTLQFAGNVNSTRPVGLAAATTFETLSGVNARLAGVITNLAVNLTNIGSGTLSVGSIASNLNNLVVNGGTLKITNGTVNVTGTSGNSLVNQSGTLEVALGGTLTLGSGVSFYSIGNVAGANSAFIVSGGIATNNAGNGTVVGRVGSGTLTVNSGLYVDNSSASRGIDIADQSTTTGGTVNLNGGTLVTKVIRCPNGTGNGGAKPAFLYFNGGTLMAGGANATFLSVTTAKLSTQVRANGGTIDNGGFNITIGDPLLHNTDTATDGGLVLQGIGTTLLNGVNTYNGPTHVNAGTLAGIGTIAGALTNNAKLYPGSGGIGNLTVNGAVRLSASSTNIFIVNGTTGLASNTLTAGSSVVYGGVLSIATNGTFALNQQIQLFKGNGATNTSNFASILGNPGTGLAFSFTNGWLKVVQGGPSGPAQLTNSYSGGVLSLSWPAGQNWRLQMQTNSLAAGLGTNWVYVTDGSVSSTNITVDATKPTAFYRLAYP